MMKTHLKKIQQERGSTLVVYMFVLAAMAAVAVAALQTITLNLETTHAHKKGKNAFYSAEVGLDLAVNDIISEFEDLSVYTTSAADPSSDANGNISVADYRNYAVDYNITNPVERFLYQTVVGNTIIYHYAHTFDIQANSTSLKDSSRETVNEQVRVLETPLVQYYIFYGGSGNDADLEILPGPTMNSWGRIHSNGDIYIGAGSKFNLRNYDTDNNLSPHSIVASGDIHLKRKNNGSTYATNKVYVKTTNTGTSFTPTENIAGTINSSNEATEEARFNNYLLVNEEPYSVPSQTLFKRGAFYETRSGDPQRTTIDGITIIGTGGVGTGNIEVYVSRPNPSTDVTALVAAMESSTGVSTGLADAITETTSAFRDCREERDVDTTNIDLNLLELWYEEYLNDQGLSLAGDGILIYTSRSPNATYTNSDTNLQAIRLMELDATSAPQLSDETTVATDNPVYIQGDFNTIDTKGVAVISDALNILSNSFPGKTGCSSGDKTNATATELNAAFFGGNVPTPSGGGNYSGGLENYPRFHENWSGIDCTIRGSFINLWTSSQATERWGKSNVYNPPGRAWGWDVRFQDPDFWPPFIPSIFSVERVGFLE